MANNRAFLLDETWGNSRGYSTIFRSSPQKTHWAACMYLNFFSGSKSSFAAFGKEHFEKNTKVGG